MDDFEGTILGNLHSEMTDQRCDSGILDSGEALFFFFMGLSFRQVRQ